MSLFDKKNDYNVNRNEKWAYQIKLELHYGQNGSITNVAIFKINFAKYKGSLVPLFSQTKAFQIGIKYFFCFSSNLLLLVSSSLTNLILDTTYFALNTPLVNVKNCIQFSKLGTNCKENHLFAVILFTINLNFSNLVISRKMKILKIF